MHTHLYMQISHDHNFITVTMQVRFFGFTKAGDWQRCAMPQAGFAQREIAVAVSQSHARWQVSKIWWNHDNSPSFNHRRGSNILHTWQEMREMDRRTTPIKRPQACYTKLGAHNAFTWCRISFLAARCHNFHLVVSPVLLFLALKGIPWTRLCLKFC